MSLKVKMWGVRGSLPTPQTPYEQEERFRRYLLKCANYERALADLKEVSGFGGHTSCVEVSQRESLLIIDGGSGIKNLGLNLLKGPCGLGRGKVHILLTHFHWDHLIGFPFFVPLFIPGNEIHFYAVQPDLEEAIKLLFRKPFFPVAFEDLGSKIFFHKLVERQRQSIDGIELEPYRLDHPDPCFGFKFHSKSGGAMGYAVDHESSRVSRKDLAEDLPLFQDLSHLVFDAQYTLLETTEKINWGHSAATVGLDIAFREEIKNVFFVHHDPNASDERIIEAAHQTESYYAVLQQQYSDLKLDPFKVNWSFAKEGTEFVV
jgi:phosphoribosyl 1,2-cyclic phosphodiesterase